MSMPFFNQSKYSCKASELVYSSQSGNLCCGFFRLGPQLQWLGREASLDRWNWRKFFLAKTDFMRVKSWNPSRETQSSGQKGVERDERNKRNKTSNKSTVGAVFVRGVWDSKSFKWRLDLALKQQHAATNHLSKLNFCHNFSSSLLLTQCCQSTTGRQNAMRFQAHRKQMHEQLQQLHSKQFLGSTFLIEVGFRWGVSDHEASRRPGMGEFRSKWQYQRG